GSPRHRVPLEPQDPRVDRRPEEQRSLRIRLRTGLVRRSWNRRVHPRDSTDSGLARTRVGIEWSTSGPVHPGAGRLPNPRLGGLPTDHRRDHRTKRKSAGRSTYQMATGSSTTGCVEQCETHCVEQCERQCETQCRTEQNRTEYLEQKVESMYLSYVSRPRARSTTIPRRTNNVRRSAP